MFSQLSKLFLVIAWVTIDQTIRLRADQMLVGPELNLKMVPMDVGLVEVVLHILVILVVLGRLQLLGQELDGVLASQVLELVHRIEPISHCDECLGDRITDQGQR